jgi:hypothetical protein
VHSHRAGIKGLRGGHRFTFTKQGSATRIDHDLAMVPTGWFRLLAPVMGMIGRRNLRDTTQALQKDLESRERLSRESVRNTQGEGLLMTRAEIANLVLGIYRATVSVRDRTRCAAGPAGAGAPPPRAETSTAAGACASRFPRIRERCKLMRVRDENSPLRGRQCR